MDYGNCSHGSEHIFHRFSSGKCSIAFKIHVHHHISNEALIL